MIRFIILSIFSLCSFIECCDYVRSDPFAPYPLVYKPGNLVLIEGTIIRVDTPPCRITPIDKKVLRKRLDSLEARDTIGLEYVDSILSTVSEKERYRWSEVKRKVLINKLKRIRIERALEKEADSVCSASRFYIQPSALHGLTVKSGQLIYFSTYSEHGAECRLLEVRDTSGQMIGQRVVCLIQIASKPAQSYDTKGNLIIENDFSFTTGGQNNGTVVGKVSSKKGEHKYKKLFFFLKDLHEEKIFSKRSDLVEKHKNLYIFQGSGGATLYKKMIDLNFPKATNEERNMLLAIIE